MVEGRGLGVEVRLLGALEVVVAGSLVEIRSAQQRAVLTALALEPGVVVSAGRLVGVLWGEEPPTSAQVTLRSLVYRLRRTLVGDPDTGDPPILIARRDGYLLDVEADAVDAIRFERLAKKDRKSVV